MESFMSFTFDVGEVLQLIAQIVISVLLPIFLTYAVVAVKSWWAKIKAQIPAEQFAFASGVIKSLVLAAEQSGLAGIIANEGQAKKQWVLDRAEKALAEHGIVMDLDALADMIEAAVKAELNADRNSAEG